MVDVHEPKVRSYNMSQIKSKNTRPEILVRRFLHKKGFRFRLHDNNLPGKPDLVLRKFKTVIFVNGCFWHMHENCKYFKLPKTRTSWWKEKLNKNKKRDLLWHKQLRNLGWNVLIVWECKIRKDPEATLESLTKAITNGRYSSSSFSGSSSASSGTANNSDKN